MWLNDRPHSQSWHTTVCCPTRDQLQFLNVSLTINLSHSVLWLYYTRLLQIFRWQRATSDFLEVRMLSSLDLRRWSAAAGLPGLRVRIPPQTLMSVSCECCVLSGRGFCEGPIPRPEKSYRLWCVWVWSWNLDNEKALADWWLLGQAGEGSLCLLSVDN